MAVLVTGGAGYIGSHMVALLCAAGRDVVVVDDLSTGHVSDLVDAHLATLDYLARGGESCAMNLGTGIGHSVAEIIETCRAVTGRDIAVVEGPRRAGDPPSLVASPALAHERLGWRATRSSPERIVSDAWAVHDVHSSANPPLRRQEQHDHAR